MTPETSELAPLRRWLTERIGSAVQPPDRLQLLLVAITEAATNAIEAHQKRGHDRPIEVAVDTGARVVTVEDRGGGFDHESQPEPQATAHRGRGLAIMRSICPDLRLVRTAAGIRVVLPYRMTATA